MAAGCRTNAAPGSVPAADPGPIRRAWRASRAARTSGAGIIASIVRCHPASRWPWLSEIVAWRILTRPPGVKIRNGYSQGSAYLHDATVRIGVAWSQVQAHAKDRPTAARTARSRAGHSDVTPASRLPRDCVNLPQTHRKSDLWAHLLSASRPYNGLRSVSSTEPLCRQRGRVVVIARV